MSDAWSFWSRPSAEVMQQLETVPQGLSGDEARRRHVRDAHLLLKPKSRLSTYQLLFRQFTSPIILILLGAAGLAFFLADRSDTAIILMIVLVSGLLGFWQERSANQAVASLLAIVQIKADVWRDGIQVAVPVEEVVPGDVVLLRAGDTIPSDCLLLASKDLFVDEATLTGETYPVEKVCGLLSADSPLARRTNSLFLGTHVVSGTGTAVVVHIGSDTEFGKVSGRLQLRPPETEFERGIRQFGYLLLEVTIVLVVAIFAVNVYLARPVLEAFLFSLALAVGLTPQLLPAIISINLAHGAKRMAQQKVIVKRLASIENFGSMTVFCSDKTGTLTEGLVRLKAAYDIAGNQSERVLLHGGLNASFETGFLNPIDEAIRAARSFDLTPYRKLDEEPYDFVRKRLSVLVATPTIHLLVTKGALANVLAVCSTAETADGTLVELAVVRETILAQMAQWSAKGWRVLGLASREMGAQEGMTKDDEAGMTFLGFLVFEDPIKADVPGTIGRLKDLGVSLKIVTGDNRLVAAYVGQAIGLSNGHLLTGEDLRQMSDEALVSRVNDVHVFAEVEPNQKERIILALKKAGHVVGYGGDGINDASALHAADVGVSVESAVDVAKEAADIVLLEKDLGILVEGVQEGRRTFANTLKYVFMATSANFGNMFSMAGASLFLSFLPLLPKQILLTNLLTDIPEMTIAGDRVDEELIDRPRRWNIVFIRKFMLTFGLVSSIFDYLTFGVLLWFLEAGVEEFRTGWFVESVISASVIVLVVRSRRPFMRSRPSRGLLVATLAVVGLTLLLPYTPLRGPLGFVPLPASFLVALFCIVVGYIGVAEVAKKIFYRRVLY
ncbi:MAG: magnesium-translocating P-type ATPase [Nitrospirae bacterium]|nr:magnesium-translocating P-type ATPase [Nitrospirota bacterium]